MAYLADILISDKDMLCSEVAMDKSLLSKIVQSKYDVFTVLQQERR